MALLSLLVMAADLHAQDRDVRAERLVLDDNGTDSTVNTVTIRTSSSLLQNVVLTIPDPGSGTAEFMLTSGSGGSGDLRATAERHPEPTSSEPRTARHCNSRCVEEAERLPTH